mmetsp:Transcript_3609/g.7785  ORF Transcript_3609/g.7785 Transcript_3609/m.7785 type:complete len:305 (-) Transcript_3609:776-1690(-)
MTRQLQPTLDYALMGFLAVQTRVLLGSVPLPARTMAAVRLAYMDALSLLQSILTPTLTLLMVAHIKVRDVRQNWPSTLTQLQPSMTTLAALIRLGAPTLLESIFKHLPPRTAARASFRDAWIAVQQTTSPTQHRTTEFAFTPCVDVLSAMRRITTPSLESTMGAAKFRAALTLGHPTTCPWPRTMMATVLPTSAVARIPRRVITTQMLLQTRQAALMAVARRQAAPSTLIPPQPSMTARVYMTPLWKDALILLPKTTSRRHLWKRAVHMRVAPTRPVPVTTPVRLLMTIRVTRSCTDAPPQLPH